MLPVFMHMSGSGERLALAAVFVLLIIFFFQLIKPMRKRLISLGFTVDTPGFQESCRLILAGLLLGVVLLTAAFLRGRADRAYIFLKEKKAVYGQIRGEVDTVRETAQGTYQITLKKGAVFRFMTSRYPCSYGCRILGLTLEDPGLRGKPLFPGDNLACEGKLSLLAGPTNPGEFNGRLYYYSRGVHYQMQADSVRRQGRDASMSIKRAGSMIGRRISAFYQAALSQEEAALFQAMVLGDKSGLSDERRSLYQENGVAHLLAVSGLHVSIVGGQIFRFLRRRRRSYGFSCSCGALMILFYGTLTGMGNSTLRAGIMYCCYLLAQFAGLEYDLASSMGLAGILMLIDCPWRIAESGCIISFASIIGIGMVLPAVRDRIPQEWKKNDRLLAGPVLFMTTLPLLMRFYYEWSPWSLLLNMIVIPMMTPLMLSAVLGGAAGTLAYGAGWILCLPARFLLVSQNLLLALASRLPWSVVVTGRISWGKVVLLYLFEYVLFRLICHRRLPEALALVCLMGALILCSRETCFRAAMLDIGQGDCILLLLPDGQTMMIDGGSTSQQKIGKYKIIPALKYYGRDHLDHVSVSHMDDDHISGVRELLESGYRIDHLVLPELDRKDQAYQDMEDLAKENGTPVARISRGDRILLSGAEFLCMHPYSGLSTGDRNDASTVLYMSYQGIDALFTGDLGEGQDPALCEYSRENPFVTEGFADGLDLLKCAHHGSKSSTTEEFLDLCKPAVTIISAGEDNRYGHPSPELVKRLPRKPYVTAWGGAIEAEIRGGRIRTGYYLDRLSLIF